MLGNFQTRFEFLCNGDDDTRSYGWQGCGVLARRTLLGRVSAPRSLKGRLNLRFSSLLAKTILIWIGMSGGDVWVEEAMFDVTGGHLAMDDGCRIAVSTGEG